MQFYLKYKYSASSKIYFNISAKEWNDVFFQEHEIYYLIGTTNKKKNYTEHPDFEADIS